MCGLGQDASKASQKFWLSSRDLGRARTRISVVLSTQAPKLLQLVPAATLATTASAMYVPTLRPDPLRGMSSSTISRTPSSSTIV